MKERFLLVTATERDAKMEVFPTLEEAQGEMLTQLQSQLITQFDDDWADEFEEDTGFCFPGSPNEIEEIAGDEIGIDSHSAYCSVEDNIDWTIFVLPGEQMDGEVAKAV